MKRNRRNVCKIAAALLAVAVVTLFASIYLVPYEFFLLTQIAGSALMVLAFVLVLRHRTCPHCCTILPWHCGQKTCPNCGKPVDL